MLLLLLITALCCLEVIYSAPYFLQVQQKTFRLNGKEVFLNGANQPWDRYSNDFGNNQPNNVFCTVNETLADIRRASGNSIRMWLFCEGQNMPQFDNSGNVVGTDRANTLISDLRLYLQSAAQQNVLVFLSLWNGAVSIKDAEKGVITDAAKTQTFIDKALIPMVHALKNETALGGWEIMNEPEGSVAIGSNSNACYDTTKLQRTGAGWTGSNIQMRDLQRFSNLLAAAIHSADPKALVTMGSWSEMASTDSMGYVNYWSDSCLRQAGGKQNGIFDFYQIHCYSYNGAYRNSQPFKQKAAAYNLNKPLIVGEFNAHGNPPPFNDNTQQYKYLYQNGYQGSWEWGMSNCGGCDGISTCEKGMNALKGKPNINIQVSGSNEINLKPRCG